MKKGWLLVGVIFLLFPLFLVGCGVSEEVYNAVLAERDAAQAQVQLLQSQLTEAQAQAQSLQGELTEVQGELTEAQAQAQSLQEDMAQAQSEMQVLKESMLRAKNNAEVVNALFIPVLTGEALYMSDAEAALLFVDWHEKIVNAKDPILMNKFNAMMDSGFEEEEEVFEFFIYALESIPEILE